MSRPGLCLSLCLTCSAALAQQAPPALMVKLGEKSEPLQLAKIDSAVRIVGFLAETRMTMTFRNPHGRVLAGDLYFPLPEGATVSGYALDIQGKLIDGVAVEKPKAREVFEKIVRQGVDPGLVEWVKGNNFKTRVFPIPAGGVRTVRVDYVTDLIQTRDGFAYHLPLRFRERVGEFRLRVEVVQGSAEPIVREGGLANFKFDKWRKGYAAETTLKDAAMAQDLIVAVPDVAKQPVQVEKAPDGQHYFCINDFPAPPPAGPEPRMETPKLVTVLWDASGSRGGGDHARELDLLAKCLDQLAAGEAAGATKWAGFPVDLVTFRDKAAAPRRFVWNNLNRREAGALYRQDLLAALKDIRYDGGTQLACISPPPDAARPDLYLLFTDGLSNFGQEDPTDLKAPVYAFSADATANHPFLRYLAMKTGGEYLNLNRLEDAEVVRSVGRPAFAFLSAAADGATLADAYPQLAQPVHGRFTFVGKLSGREAKIALQYGDSGKMQTKSDFVVDRELAVEGDLLRRFWAQKKVEDLSVFPKRHEQVIAAVGKEFGIVTPGTSLLVLESLEQYLEHRIAPPKSLPEMYAEYQRRMDSLEMQAKQQRQEKIGKVLEMWKERVAWWDKEFKYPKDFKYAGKADKSGGGDHLAPAGAEGGGGPPRPAGPGIVSPSTPPPAAQPADPARDRGQRTGAAPLAEEAERGREGLFNENASPAARLSLFAPAANGKNGGDGGERVGQPGVLIQPWDPKTPYLEALKKAAPAERFAVYLDQRAKHGTSPAFFLDCAEFFREAGEQELAVQVLSNVAELELENAALIRVLAHKLAQWEHLDLAAGLFEQALELRGEEPQSYRDLAGVLARQGKLTRAIELLWQVVMKHWDERFSGVEPIVLMELNRLIPRAKAAGIDAEKLGVDPRVIKLLDADVRIVLTWDADSTDIDLWVTEPSAEKVFYSHNRSQIGGYMSRDFTQGYGPEEYFLRKGMNGVYRIEVNYYGTSAAQLLGSVTLQVDIYTNYGRPNEQHKAITRRLREKQETIPIGEVEY